MAENFEKTFMTSQYKEYREEVLIEREIVRHAKIHIRII
jgi:hypothetical protein